MRKPVILVTGANGEMGHGLIEFLGTRGIADDAGHSIVALDLNTLDASLDKYCDSCIVGDILDQNLLQRLVSEYEIHAIYHLAALLSTRAEYTPDTAHKVNVNGTLNLLQLAHEQARWHGNTVKFLFPSSIAVYGLPDVHAKREAGRVREQSWNFPTTMYGCNKLYCEQLGRYYTHFYRQLAAETLPSGVDFRAIRFPGIISAKTLPTGGTSDFAPEMLHAAAKGEPYTCFVGESAQIPFMVMPDAIKGLVRLSEAPQSSLTRHAYNITAFSRTAGEFRDLILESFPDAQISFDIDPPRAAIVDTWPADIDDSAARRDWDWQPDYDMERAFSEYLIPSVVERYKK